MSLQVLQDITSSPELNSDETIKQSQDILDSLLASVNETNPLTPQEAQKVAKTMD